jgi:hypothetical protein
MVAVGLSAWLLVRPATALSLPARLERLTALSQSAVPLPFEVRLAASGPTVLVLVLPVDGPTKPLQAPMELEMFEAMKASGRFEAVSPLDGLDPQAAAARASKIDFARTRLAEGQKALDDLDTAKAVEAFSDALRQLKECDSSKTWDELIKAFVMKASSHSLGGETALAKQDIERILVVAPKAEFASQYFPPDQMKLIEQQRKVVVAAKAELTVRTEPPGANVWVDGQFRGQSPVTIKPVAAGRHQVVAALGGYALGTMELAAPEGTLELKPTELDAAFKKVLETSAHKGPDRDAALVALGKKANVDQVFALVLKKNAAGDQIDLTALRIETKDGHNAGFATATLPMADWKAPLKAAVLGVIESDARRQANRPVTHFSDPKAAEPTTPPSPRGIQRVVGVSLLAVAVGLFASGIVTAILGQDRFNAFRATPQVESRRLGDLRREGQLFGAISLGSFIGGAASGGVGFGLFWMSLMPEGNAQSASDAKKPPEGEPGSSRIGIREEKRLSSEAMGLDDGKKDDGKKVGAKTDEVKKDEVKKDEVKKDEVKKDEVKKDEVKKDEVKKDDEQRMKAEAEAKKRAEAEEKKAEEKKAEERQKAEAEEKRRAEEERKRQEAEAKKSAKDIRKDSKKDEARRKAEDAAAEEKRKKEEEEKKRREDEERRKREEEKKKEDEKKKKEEDHDDLKNY